MGLSGNHKNDPAFGDRVRAAFAMLNGDQNAPFRFQQLQLERQRLGLTQAQQQREQQAQDDQIWAAKQNGFSPAQISQLNPNDLSQLGRERFTPRQYGPEGGSTGYTNADGTTRYEVAPYQRQVGRTVIGAGPNGADPRVVFRGSETIGVPNVGVFGTTELGPYQQGEAPPLGFIQQSAVTGPGNGQTPPFSGNPRDLPPGDPRADPAGPPSADMRPMGQEAPAFNANPADLANMPPVASYRGVEFGSPLAGGRPRNMPPRAAARPPRGIVTVNSPEEAARLPRGTRFRTPDGRVIVRQ